MISGTQAVILSPFGISPGREGCLRLRHVADVRLWARRRTQKRSDKEIGAGHVGDIASGASYAPLKIMGPPRSSKAHKATSETPKADLRLRGVGARSAIDGSTTLCDQSFDAVSVATSRLVAKDRGSAISSQRNPASSTQRLQRAVQPSRAAGLC